MQRPGSPLMAVPERPQPCAHSNGGGELRALATGVVQMENECMEGWRDGYPDILVTKQSKTPHLRKT